MQQHSKDKGKGKALEPLVCNRCMECGLECELGPGKLTLYTECCKAKAKCEWPSEEKPERKCKQVQAEESKTGPGDSKRLKKTSEERSNGVVELVEVLEVGLKAIMNAFSK